MLIGNKQSFTVATYNVLADGYINPKYYPRCDLKDFDWRVRHPRLVTRVVGLDADVVCLQEVEISVFAALDQVLRKLGYAGRWAHKSNGKPDGCATFVRNALGKVRWEIWELDGPDDRPSGHVALMAHLDRGRGPSVVNTHLKWDSPDRTSPSGFGTGYSQAGDLVFITRSWPRTIVCGDFNVTPDGMTMDVFRAMGFIDPHPPTLATFNNAGPPRKLDYILHRDDLQARPLPATALTQDSVLPSATEPSDHVPIMAEFTAAAG